MTFRAYSSVIFGMALVGFALGIVLGVYLHHTLATHWWAYIAVPATGAGGGLAAYGTLSTKKRRNQAEESDG